MLHKVTRLGVAGARTMPQLLPLGLCVLEIYVDADGCPVKDEVYPGRRPVRAEGLGRDQ